MKSCTPLWREAHLQVKKLTETSRSEHFWKLSCRKSARRCGAKHVSMSHVQKTRLIPWHYTTPHYITVTTTTATTTATLLYTTLHYTTLLHITLHSLHHHKRNCNYTTLITLHHTTTPLHYNYNYSRTTPHYIEQLWVRWPTRWTLQPLQPFQKTQLHPPFSPLSSGLASNDIQWLVG